MDSKLRVHIATVDHHIERITEPLINLRADKAYIVTYGQKDAAVEFLKKTEKILKKHRISYKVVFVDLWNLMACVQKFRDLILQEDGNQIFFNVSTGTKISAISAMLSCMIWNCQPYYAKPDYSDRRVSREIAVEEIKEIVSMPIYKMNSPKTEHLQILQILQQHDGKIKKRNLIEELKNQNTIKSVDLQELSKPAEYGQLKTILDPMIKLEYVDVKVIGRNNIVSITPQGENTLEIFGDKNWKLE